jgi:exodeoxyribonuclease V alpha subunit
VLAGSVERVTFHNEENGFCVLRVSARGHRDLVTVVGHAAAISAGEFIRATGEWVNSREHGLQLRARHLRASPPDTAEGLERYLGFGMIRASARPTAKRLVAAFGTRVFEVVEAEPERLRTVGGIGPGAGHPHRGRLGRAEDRARDHALPACARVGTRAAPSGSRRPTALRPSG